MNKKKLKRKIIMKKKKLKKLKRKIIELEADVFRLTGDIRTLIRKPDSYAALVIRSKDCWLEDTENMFLFGQKQRSTPHHKGLTYKDEP